MDKLDDNKVNTTFIKHLFVTRHWDACIFLNLSMKKVSLLEDNNLAYEWWLGIEHSPFGSKACVYILSHCTIQIL